MEPSAIDTNVDPNLVRLSHSFGEELLLLAKLAWPVVLGQVAIVGMNLVDTLLAGRISAQILAEVALGTSVWGFVQLGLMGMMMAMAPEIARMRGAGGMAAGGTAPGSSTGTENRTHPSGSKFADTLNQGLYLALLVSLVAVVVNLAAPILLPLAGVRRSLIPGALDFVQGISWGAPALAWYLCLLKFCEGMGRTIATLYFSLLGLCCLVPLAYMLMNGVWGAPRWLSFGSGVATALVYWINAIGATIYVFLQFSEHSALRVWRAPNWRRIGAIAAFGGPIAVTILMEAGLFYSVVLLMSRFGKDWVAAHSVAINVASFAFMLPLGLASAVTVRVGFSVGRGSLDNVRRSALAGYVLCLVTQAFSASVMVLFALPIAGLYLPHEPEVVMLAAGLIGFAAIFQFPDGIQVISAGALRGLKDVKWPMLLTTISYWGLGFPLAHYLAFSSDLRARGLWYGFILGLSAAALLLTLRFWYVYRGYARLRSESHP